GESFPDGRRARLRRILDQDEVLPYGVEEAKFPGALVLRSPRLVGQGRRPQPPPSSARPADRRNGCSGGDALGDVHPRRLRRRRFPRRFPRRRRGGGAKTRPTAPLHRPRRRLRWSATWVWLAHRVLQKRRRPLREVSTKTVAQPGRSHRPSRVGSSQRAWASPPAV